MLQCISSWCLLSLLWPVILFHCLSWPWKFWEVSLRHLWAVSLFEFCWYCPHDYTEVWNLGKNTKKKWFSLYINSRDTYYHHDLSLQLLSSRQHPPGLSTVEILHSHFFTILFRTKSVSPIHTQGNGFRHGVIPV